MNTWREGGMNIRDVFICYSINKSVGETKLWCLEEVVTLIYSRLVKKLNY